MKFVWVWLGESALLNALARSIIIIDAELYACMLNVCNVFYDYNCWRSHYIGQKWHGPECARLLGMEKCVNAYGRASCEHKNMFALSIRRCAFSVRCSFGGRVHRIMCELYMIWECDADAVGRWTERVPAFSSTSSPP